MYLEERQAMELMYNNGKAIILMQRGENNIIREINFSEAFSFLLQQTYQPNGTEALKKTLTLVSELKEKVRFFQFVFNNLKEDAFYVAHQALTEDIYESNN